MIGIVYFNQLFLGSKHSHFTIKLKHNTMQGKTVVKQCKNNMVFTIERSGGGKYRLCLLLPERYPLVSYFLEQF